MSLRTSSQVATALDTIINPKNLKIEGFYCQDSRSKKQLILVTNDIREILSQGLVVNDYDVLSEAEDLVRLKPTMKLKFELLGKNVFTESKQKLGKVNDFAADSDTLIIQKFYIGQSLVKGFRTGQLSVDRSQIVEITNKKIVIQDIDKPLKGAVPVNATVQ